MKLTVKRSRSTLSDLVHQDDGIGLLLVIGIASVVSILLAITTATAIRSLRSSADHVSFEQALAASESGIDEELSRIQTARNQVPSVTYETAAGCSVAAPPSSTFASETTEKTWARAALSGLPTSCTRSNGQGQYVALKVPGRQVVYSLGWSPSRTDPNAADRLLKAEYIFAPYRPGKAVLTGGNIDFSGSIAVNAVSGLGADIHTNAGVTGINGSTSVSGSITAAGTISGCSSSVTGGCQSGQPPQRVPVANPRAVYTDYATTTGQWYDLCNDGTVRSPASTGPCTGTQISTSPYRSWYWTAGSSGQPGVWTLQNTGTSYPGVYYVYGANAQVGATGNSATVQTVSVLVEATRPSGYTNAATCDKFGGDLTWKLFDIQNYLRGVIFIAQGSLYGQANSTAQSGLLLAGDKVELNTSSATVRGSIIANNTCAAAGTNSIQGMTVTYDEAVEAPVYSVVNTTLWLEYTG